MSTTAWRASLRIARREAWRNRGRSALIIALIGLPVLVLAVADIAYRTWQLSPQEKLARTIGHADAIVRWNGGTGIKQDPRRLYDLTFSTVGNGTTNTEPPAPPTATLLANLPPGTRAIRWKQSTGGVDSARGRALVQLNGLDYGDPMTRGLVKPVRGHAPRTTGEIALTRTLADNLGLHLGDTVRTVRPDGTFRLVGIVAGTSTRNATAAYVLPAALPAGSSGDTSVENLWLVDGPGALTWSDVLALNKGGYVAVSRQVYLHAPPKSQVGYTAQGPHGISPKSAATGILVGGMALLEIVLLAGPAFAVSARRQRHDLALLAAVGGRREDLRNVVLAKGVVLGLAGGLVSAVAAVGLAAIGIAAAGPHVDPIPGGFDVRPLELLALTGVSLVAALAAAVFPALGAARTEVVTALAGRRGIVRTRKRVPLFGVLVAGAGVLVALGGLGASANGLVILTGVALTEVGLIVCLPALLGLASRAGRWLPLSPRIALRDAARNRSSAASAIAAVMAAVIGCVAALIGVASAHDQDRRSYQPIVPVNEGYVGPLGGHNSTPDRVIAALQSTLPGSRAVPLTVPGGGCTDRYTCDQTAVGPAGATNYTGRIPAVLVDDGSSVETLMRARVPAAVDALRAGRAVVTDPSMVANGTVSLDISDGTANSDKTARVPAVVVDSRSAFVQVVLPPSLLARLHVKSHVEAVYVDTAHRPTTAERQAADAALGHLDPYLNLEVETGFHSSRLMMMLTMVVAAAAIAIGATMIATALSNVDSRPDLTTLAAVGAAPRTRRVLSMSRAGVIATLGTVLGAAAGFVPSVAWLHAQSFRIPLVGSDGSLAPVRLVVPWLPLTVVVVAVPIAAMLVAGLFSRSRLPSERSAD
jgi:putative ABC transport system permease protein